MPSAMSLHQLRALLHSRIDPAADWESALVDAAARAREALAASRALIALPIGGGQWRVYLDSGEQVAGAAVSLVASSTVLERAVREGLVRERVEGPALQRSASMDRQHIHSVIAVALARHGTEGPASAPLGVLYLDRREDRPAFGAEEEQWARDFAAISERLLTLIELLARARREREAALADNDALRTEQFGSELDVLDSRDPVFQDQVGRVLAKAAKADRVTVLLQGPTGSGKTHLARRFHALSRRRERPFVTLDCGQASNADALAAELFGFSKRSGFNVDAAGRAGKALLADGGILFIDEINSMPLELQPRLLRLVESGRYSALGSGDEVNVDIQVIAATNRDLRELVRERAFREDLYFRLGQLVVTLPPLGERRADVVPLAERMLAAAARHFETGPLHFAADALALLEGFAWERAGNLRGLQHTIERTVLMLDTGRRRVERDDLVLPDLLAATAEATPAPTGSNSPSIEPLVASSRLARGAETASLRELLRDKVREHRGIVARMAEDQVLTRVFGTGGRAIPASTLRQRLARLGLLETLEAEREANDATLEEVIAALRQHGNGVDAARDLGISRDRLVWRLRQAGLTIGRVLGEDDAGRPG